MKHFIHQLNKLFDNRIRLGIMSILVVNDWVDFKEMKTLLDLTDGNLSSHITALENASYIEIKKEFVGKKPNTSYKVSKLGRLEFEKHLSTLEKLLKDT